MPKAKIGRPAGREYPHSVHLRLGDEHMEYLSERGGDLSKAIRECVEAEMQRTEEREERSRPRVRAK